MTNTQTASLLFMTGILLTVLSGCGVTDPKTTAALIDKLVREGSAPGAQYVHVDQDAVIFSHEAGTADLAGADSVNDQTTFHGYSVTKTFTSAAVMKLASEGKVDLDAPISKYVPGLPDPRVPTVRQTLQHTGGWANPVPIGWVHLAEEHEAFNDEAFFERIMKEHGMLASNPGDGFAYSNVGYLVLGELVRRVSGRPYVEYVAQEIVAPLQLSDEELLAFSIDAPARHATGYVRRFSFLDLSVGLFLERDRFLDEHTGDWVPFRPMFVDGPAYGGMIGNARGFARYLQAILRHEGALTEEVVTSMFTPGTLNNGDKTAAAHGWFRGDLDGEPYFHHAGGGGGYYCEIRVYPRLGRASAVMFNRSAMSDDRLLDRIDRTMLADEHEANDDSAP